MKRAVAELEIKLTKLNNISYRSIDKLMRTIMKKYELTARQLHDAFVRKHRKTPDEWIKSILNESKSSKIRKKIEHYYDLGSRVPYEGISIMSSPEELLKKSGESVVKKEVKDKKKRREAAISKLTKRHMKTFEEFMFIVENIHLGRT